jgi:hypothetical protein
MEQRVKGTFYEFSTLPLIHRQPKSPIDLGQTPIGSNSNFSFFRTKTESPPAGEEISGGAKWGDSDKRSLPDGQAERA